MHKLPTLEEYLEIAKSVKAVSPAQTDESVSDLYFEFVTMSTVEAKPASGAYHYGDEKSHGHVRFTEDPLGCDNIRALCPDASMVEAVLAKMRKEGKVEPLAVLSRRNVTVEVEPPYHDSPGKFIWRAHD